MGKQKSKNDYEEERVEKDGMGNVIHIFDGPLGKRFIKELNPAAWLPTGEQYCPNCHCVLIHKSDYWECGKCSYQIADDEADDGEGYPSLESTYDDDYGTCYDDDDDDDEGYDYLEEYE